MRRNIEIKARLGKWERTLEVAKSISGQNGITFFQEDTFLRTPRGRLKLRCTNRFNWELIYYERPNLNGPKLSSFIRLSIKHHNIVRKILSAMFGVRGLVSKERTLVLLEDARIHFDRVQGLGNFLELEVFVKEASDVTNARQRSEALMNMLGIHEKDLVDGAYLDLLQERGTLHMGMPNKG